MCSSEEGGHPREARGPFPYEPLDKDPRPEGVLLAEKCSSGIAPDDA